MSTNEKFKEMMNNKYSSGPVLGMIHNHVIALQQAGDFDNTDEAYAKAYDIQLERVLQAEIRMEARLAELNTKAKVEVKPIAKKSF